MATYRGFDRKECIEDCPRCNRCSPQSARRVQVDAMIIGWELEKLRYETDGLPVDWPSAAEWHSRVERTVGAP